MDVPAMSRPLAKKRENVVSFQGKCMRMAASLEFGIPDRPLAFLLGVEQGLAVGKILYHLSAIKAIIP